MVQSSKILLLAFCLFLLGCVNESEDKINSAPRIITETELESNFSDDPLTIDHINVFDPDNDEISYDWSISSEPYNSNAVLVNASLSQPVLYHIAPGSYSLRLDISDGITTVRNYIEVNIHPLPLLSNYQVKSLPDPSQVNAVSIGDFNSNGLNDLAVIVEQATAYSIDNESALLIFKQNLAGDLSEPEVYSVSSVPSTHKVQSMSVADLNGDGRDDIAISYEFGFRVFYQKSDGLFEPVEHTASTEITNPINQIMLVDINRDGLHDVISMFDNWSNSNIEVFRQSPVVGFDIPQQYSMTHSVFDRVSIGDIDNNGLDDIVYLNRANDIPLPKLGVLYQETPNDFSPILDLAPNLNITTTRPISMFDISVGDINSDGLMDIIYSYGGNKPDASLGVIYQMPDNSLSESVRYISYDLPQEILINDVNGDGKNDVIIKHSGWHRVGVMLQEADGTLGVEHLYPSIYAGSNLPNTMVIGDINSDGKNDVIIGDGDLVVFYNASE